MVVAVVVAIDVDSFTFTGELVISELGLMGIGGEVNAAMVGDSRLMDADLGFTTVLEAMETDFVRIGLAKGFLESSTIR